MEARITFMCARVTRICVHFLLVGVSLAGGQAVSKAQGQAATRYIRKVEIVRHNVFSASDGELTAIDKMANKLHFVTRDAVIRRELTFVEGDTLDGDLIEESERNLRDLDFFVSAEIRAEYVGTDSVDVVVVTQDQWSMIPGFILASGGGLTEVGGFLEEFNLFGYGKDLFIEGVYQSDVDGTRWSFGYTDPQFLSSRWTLYSIVTTGPLIEGYELFLKRPFYSVDTRWSYGGGGYSTKEIDRLFNDGDEISRFNVDSDYLTAFVSHARGERFKKWRFWLSYRYEERIFSPIPGETTLPLADDELIYATTITMSRQNVRHVKTTQLDKFVTTEDYEMGGNTKLSVGRAGFPIPKGLDRWELDIAHRQARRFGDNQHLFTNLGYEAEEDRNIVWRLGARYYHRWWKQTLALNVNLKLAKELELSRQFVLGAESGLRGYPAREFSGDKRILVNLESRIIPSWELWTVQLGGVVFVDGGNVWKRTRSIDLRDMNYSAGVGMRFGFPKIAGATVARIDVGWPLNNSGGPVFTIGAEQHFSAR